MNNDYDIPPTIQEEMTTELGEMLSQAAMQQTEIRPTPNINTRDLNISYLVSNSQILAQAGIYFNYDGITDENLSALALLVRHFNTSCDQIQDFQQIRKLIRKIQISENSSAKKRCCNIL